MSMSTDWLIQKILDFMAVLYECYTNTTYAQDRTVYAKDIAMAMGWIVKIKNGDNLQDVVNQILGPETDKYFGDYWRQGEWGEKELEALKSFKKELEAA